MKTNILVTASLLSLVICQSSVGQGPLVPPGAPAPTMKTLLQVEPRTPISSLPVFIGQSGSYYLTDNFTIGVGQDYGIFISANNVTIDLNGFTIRSVDPTNANIGIRIDTSPFAEFHDITILNGHIVGNVVTNGGIYTGSGFGYGIKSFGNPRNVRVAGVTVSGCLYDGIRIGIDDSTTVESCTVSMVGGFGIAACSVTKCVAFECGLAGIAATTASDCVGISNSSYPGLNAYSAHNCVGKSASGMGLGCNIANNCTGVSSGGVGLFALIANNCWGQSSSSYGVNGIIANNSFGASVSGIGLRCVGGTAGTGIATGCYGESVNSVGLNAYIANGCVGVGPTPISVSYKFNMP